MSTRRVEIPEFKLSLSPKEAKALKDLLNQKIHELPAPKRAPRVRHEMTEKKYREELVREVKRYYEALSGEDFPKDGVTSHHGVGFPVGKDYVSFTTRSRDLDGKQCEDRLLVIIRRSKDQYAMDYRGESYPVGYSKKTHMARIKLVAKTLGGTILECWNGTNKCSSVSVVVEVPAPKGLVTAIQNYGELEDVFDYEAYKPQSRRFDLWLKKRLGQEK